MLPLVAHCHLGLGTLFVRTGSREQAQEHLTTATTMYREMDMPFYLEQAEAESRDSRGGTCPQMCLEESPRMAFCGRCGARLAFLLMRWFLHKTDTILAGASNAEMHSP